MKRVKSTKDYLEIGTILKSINSIVYHWGVIVSRNKIYYVDEIGEEEVIFYDYKKYFAHDDETPFPFPKNPEKEITDVEEQKMWEYDLDPDIWYIKNRRKYTDIVIKVKDENGKKIDTTFFLTPSNVLSIMRNNGRKIYISPSRYEFFDYFEMPSFERDKILDILLT